jgi:integrase
MAHHASRAKPLRHHAGAEADPGSRRQVVLHGPQPGKLAGRNPQPPPRPVRAYTYAELEAIAAELSPRYRALPAFAAATGLRPEEWQALERRDVDRVAGILNVRRTVSSGEVVELAKRRAAAARCRYRRVPSLRSTRSRPGSTAGS